MDNSEKKYIASLPEKYRPISSWSYFWLGVLYSLPIIGIIMLIIHALGADNINRRSYARSYFCVYAVFFVLIIIMLASGTLASVIEALSND